MIAFLRGRVLDKQPNKITVDVQGVGYEVHVPLSTYYDVGEEGAEVALRVHTHVREESLQLFGFLTPLEQQLFERLIGISGIGPKLAIAVLSGIDSAELVGAVQRGDVARLTSVPGIGRKTAERLVVELRDKLDFLPTLSAPARARDGGVLPKSDRFDDAVAALVTLGYSSSQAQEAVRKAGADSPDLSLEDIVKRSLARLGRAAALNR